MSTGPDPATTDDPAAAERLPLRRRLLPVLALLLVAPWAAECSWGGFAIDGFLPVVIGLAPMYGGAAILIRETARRLGAGWPTIVLLAAAFGVLQAGLVDQSLFNPGYLNDTQYADTRAAAEATLVPGLGFSLRQAFDYVGNHIRLGERGQRRRVRVPGAAVLPGEPGGGPGRRHRGKRRHGGPGRRCPVAAAPRFARAARRRELNRP
ncbi:hypothetical protein [Micromonospora sp. NPDC049274]|uniref:hypothetical protein n=1 Tax=Micromonospora sp. NPDC049274 TaxID=3154829 RepID=UPI00343A7253